MPFAWAWLPSVWGVAIIVVLLLSCDRVVFNVMQNIVKRMAIVAAVAK